MYVGVLVKVALQLGEVLSIVSIFIYVMAIYV
jgi:hypothetical protein